MYHWNPDSEEAVRRNPTDGEWIAFGRHAGRIWRHGPSPEIHADARCFRAFSGLPRMDANMAGLYGDATDRDAIAIVAAADRLEVPVVLGIGSGADPTLAEPLRAAGFVRHEPEVLFGMVGAPEPRASRFEVRRVESFSDMDAALRLVEEVHGHPAREMGPVLRAALATPAVVGWIAWDGPDAASFAAVTREGNSRGLWMVSTALRQRRQGAASALLRRALANGDGISTRFWSSPDGLPFYASLGFTPLDRIDVWTRGASAEELASIGAKAAA